MGKPEEAGGGSGFGTSCTRGTFDDSELEEAVWESESLKREIAEVFAGANVGIPIGTPISG